MHGRKGGAGLAHRLAVSAVFLSLAVAAGLLERLLTFDLPVPGVKLGLANVIVLAAMYLFSSGFALRISLLKCVLTAAVTGAGMSFVYSVSGAVLSFTVMAAVLRVGREKVSPIGVSVSGAVFHNIGQIAAAALIMRTALIVSYLPVLLFSGVVTGVLTGVVVKLTVRRLKSTGRFSLGE